MRKSIGILLLVLCISHGLASEGDWSSACARMPLVAGWRSLCQTNCSLALLRSFSSNAAAKALVLMPKATDAIYFTLRGNLSLTNENPTLLDAIMLLTNKATIRVAYRRPYLLLHAEADLLLPLIRIQNFETADRLAAKSVALPPVQWDASWERLQPAARTQLGVKIQPAIKSAAWWHFYRAHFAAWNLNGWELVETLCLATRSTAIIQVKGIEFAHDPRRQLLSASVPYKGQEFAGLSPTEYLNVMAGELLAGCRIDTDQGHHFYTPDGHGHYRALWTRDFAYMVQNAGEWMPPTDVETCLRALIKGMRSDGATPDRVRADGVAVYAAGSEQRPLGEPNIDNAQFLVIAVDAHLKRLSSRHALALFGEWESALGHAMDYIPRSQSGLVFNDPRKPHSPYGFTDTVRKTGDLCMESLLYWLACKRLADWHKVNKNSTAAREFQRRAQLIENSLSLLWDEPVGAFLAASKDCRQIDVWANAYALDIGFPLSAKRARIQQFLADHFNQFIWHGQVRHLLVGQTWESLLTSIPPGRYQNGAYWATASGWAMGALAEKNPALARRMFDDLIADFQTGGICECVNEGYRQLPSYVVSAANPLAAARRLKY